MRIENVLGWMDLRWDALSHSLSEYQRRGFDAAQENALCY